MGLNVPAVFAHGSHGVFHIDLVLSLRLLAVHGQRNLAARTNSGLFPAITAAIAHKHIEIVHFYHPLSLAFRPRA